MNTQVANTDMDQWLSQKLDELLPGKLQTIEDSKTPSMAIIATKGTLDWAYPPFILASTASTPLWGKVGDLMGRKRIFQAAIGIFLVGSALSGLSENMAELIAFRAVQGLGAGGLMVTAMAIVGDIVSMREVGRYQGQSLAYPASWALS